MPQNAAATPATAVSSSGDATGPHAAQAALTLYARVLSARSLPAAAHGLVSALALASGADRVCLAMRQDSRTRLLAGSNLEIDKAPAELRQRLLGAMDEAIEQGLPLQCPAPDGAEANSAGDWIRLEHRALQRLTGGAVASVPLGRDGDVFAAVCVERHRGGGFDAGELARIENLLLLAAPALQWMMQAHESWHRRMRRDLARSWSALRQPDQRAKRRWLAVGLVALLFLTLVPLPHDIGGRARIEGAQQRVLSAPGDGFVKTAHVRPGDQVTAGQPLVDMLEQDLRLERERWSSQLAQQENAYAAAMAGSQRMLAATSMARMAEAQSQIALVDEQLQRSQIVAPFDALVIQGDLSQSIGAPVRQGDALLTLATLGDYRVIVQIDEGDIARVHAGQRGALVLSSLPWDRHAMQVLRVAPLAKAVDGRNVFEVEAQLLQPPPGLRPGLLGRADLRVGRLPLLWAWSRHAVQRIRLVWWSWL